MLQDFFDWLSEQSAERGLGRMIVGVTSILGVAGAVGTLFGSFPLRAGAFVGVLLGCLTFTTFLLREYRAVRRERETLSRLLQQYCQAIKEGSELKLRFARWHQTIVINPQGDVVATRRFSVTPVGADLRFLTLNLCYYGISPLSARRRRQVQATAREISVDGVGGARFVTMPLWRGDAEHQILVHFSTPIPAGHEVTVEAQWHWPLYSSDLMQGGIEDFDVKFEHSAEVATQKVVLFERARTARFAASQIGRLTDFEFQVSDASCEAICRTVQPVVGERFGVRIDKARA